MVSFAGQVSRLFGAHQGAVEGQTADTADTGTNSDPDAKLKRRCQVAGLEIEKLLSRLDAMPLDNKKHGAVRDERRGLIKRANALADKFEAAANKSVDTK